MEEYKKDLAPYEKIILDKERKAEIRIYDGDEDPNILNRKRIGIYLFVDNKFISSQWIECGKYVKNTLINNPRMTREKKKRLTNEYIELMKATWSEMNK